MASLIHVSVDSADAFERGRQRGKQVANQLHRTWPVYERLFAITAREAGQPPVDVRAVAAACLDCTAAWAPDLVRELEGVAAGAGADLATIMALNARTEIFAQARGGGPTECSTVVELVGTEGTSLAAQTWDWHEELSGGWHVQSVRGTEHSFVGLAEFGMLAKIGVNDSGLAVLFNLLRHVSDTCDAAGGVPVHLLAHEVLARCSSVAEAVELVDSVPVLASTVVTVVTAAEAACLELSPDGVGVVHPAHGWLVHTNHFLSPDLALGERVTEDVTTTFERESLLRSRVKGLDLPIDAPAVVALLHAHDADGVAVCRHPDLDAPTGYRTATLATVGIDPARRAASISAGGPCRRTDVIELTARA